MLVCFNFSVNPELPDENINILFSLIISDLLIQLRFVYYFQIFN